MGIFRRRPKPQDEFVLGNAEDRHAESPRTFFIPSRPERESAKPGQHVKLLFELRRPTGDMPAAERMWVRVLEVSERRYVGGLDNRPRALRSIKPGSRITFGPEHIIAVQENWPMGEMKVMVSKRSHVDDQRPRFACRDEPLSSDDSGWQVLVGDETDEELSDSSNVLLQQVGFVVDRWPELRPMFEVGEIGSEWLWDESSGSYRGLEKD